MKQHLTIMSNMISELGGASHELSDEQQVQAVIRSLPSVWKHLCINLTHNDNIKTSDDVSQHVKLEEDRLLVDKPNGHESLQAPNEKNKKVRLQSRRREAIKPTSSKTNASTKDAQTIKART